MNDFSVYNLSAGYGKQNILEGITFQIHNGCLMGVLGANGSGKTTLLKSICGILPHEGMCTLDGQVLEDLSPKRLSKLVSYIPQQSGISIDISALDVVLMGFNPHLGLLEYPTESMKKGSLEALQKCGLSGKEHYNYQHLSQGQKQLCILARTLAADSKLLLLDEPESALDFRFRYQILAMLKDWVSAGNRSAVVTLHDPALALNYCDRLLLLSEGGILGIAEPKNDPIRKTEEMLSEIYGKISLQVCHNRSGDPQIVMLKEDEQ